MDKKFNEYKKIVNVIYSSDIFVDIMEVDKMIKEKDSQDTFRKFIKGHKNKNKKRRY